MVDACIFMIQIKRLFQVNVSVNNLHFGLLLFWDVSMSLSETHRGDEYAYHFLINNNVCSLTYITILLSVR